MDATRVPTPPPATEGGMPNDEAIRQLRQSVAGFAHYDDNAPQLSSNVLRSRVPLRELDRLAAERDAASRESDEYRVLAGLLYIDGWAGGDGGEPGLMADHIKTHYQERIAAALAPRPAAPASEGGGA